VSRSGAVVFDVRKNQVSTVKKETGLIALSITGNDIGFTAILKACVFYYFGNCDTAIANARRNLYNPQIFNGYSALIKEIQRNFMTTRDVTTIYQTAYLSFFEDYTEQCNKVRFNRALRGPLMLQDTRKYYLKSF